MMREFELAVLLSLSVPVQLSTCQPEAGTALFSWMYSPATYSPEEQPVEFEGAATGSLPKPV